MGAVSSGNYNVGFVYMSEMFAPKHRSVVGNVVNVVWSVSTAVLPGIALLIPNWQWLLIAISIPNFATIPWILFFPGAAKGCVHLSAYPSVHGPSVHPSVFMGGGRAAAPVVDKVL